MEFQSTWPHKSAPLHTQQGRVAYASGQILEGTKGSKSIRVNGEQLHKCISHIFQFIRKFLLQWHCKMHVRACVKLAKSLFLNCFICQWVGIALSRLLMDCMSAVQTPGLPPPSTSMLWCPHLSMFMATTKPVLAGPSPFSLFPCPVHPLNVASCTTYMPHLCHAALVLAPQNTIWNKNLVLQLPTSEVSNSTATAVGWEISFRRCPSIALFFVILQNLFNSTQGFIVFIQTSWS